MSLTLTVIDDVYTNAADGTKTVRYTGSFTNPYTAGGESIDVSTLFPHKFLGGRVEMIAAAVAIAAVGPLATAVIRGDTSSTSTVVLQLLSVGLPGTTAAGAFVDNSVANISGYSCTIALTGY